MVRRSVGDGALPSVTPGHFNGHAVRLVAGGEGPHKSIAREVTAAADDFLALCGQAWGEHADPGAHAACVWRPPAKADGDARARRIVAAQQRRVVEAVDNDIEVAVIVEVGQGHAVRDSARIEAPGCPDLLEGQVTAIAKGDVWSIEAQEAFAQAQLLQRRHRLWFLRLFNF